MSMLSETIRSVRESAAKKMLFLPHAVRQMSRPERMISIEDVREALATGAVIEDYPDDARGHSCLILGAAVNGAPIHVVCAPKATTWLSSQRISRTPAIGSQI